MPRCDACALDLSPVMYTRHLERDHKLDLCTVCAHPVLKYSMTPLGSSLAFCSSTCVAEFRRRGTCFNCLKRPASGSDPRLCAHCLETSRGGWREAIRVDQQLRAIRRAERLPEVYQRNGPVRWHEDSSKASEVVA